MTVEEKKLWREGSYLWIKYVNVNGYSFTFDNKGIKKLSKVLGLNCSYIRKRLSIYLEN